LVVLEFRTFQNDEHNFNVSFDDSDRKFRRVFFSFSLLNQQRIVCKDDSSFLLDQTDPPCQTVIGQSLTRVGINPPASAVATFGGSVAELEVVSAVDAVQRCAHETATVFDPLRFAID
jgi:hypothetical protein